ncbi:17881_t:CDS:1, partial [Funneliformis geosporum]
DINVREYIHIEDEMPEGRLTDKEIVDSILNTNKKEENVDETEFMPEKISPAKVEKSIDEIIRFLYKQESEFGKVNEELKALRKLYKRIKLLIVKNLKQVNLHYFNNDIIE